MRKQTKIAAVVSAAALLALGASMTSFAASKGTWMMVDGEWYCYDKNGDAYTNVFCSSNGKEYYVGDDGQLVRSEWVDYDGSYYFVNSSGAKITNDWRLTTPYDDDSADEEWYYFKSNGKRAEGEKVTYKGKTYYFDTDGKMLTGWVTTTSDKKENVNEATGFEDGHTFYCDETGARVEGAWIKDTAPGVSDDSADEDEYWYYLKKTTGKPATGKQSNINGQIYLFNEEGQMQYGWVARSDSSTKNFVQLDKEDEEQDMILLSEYADSEVYYCGDEDDGHAKKNKWLKTWLPSDTEEEEDDKEWFWFDKNGKLYRASGSDATVKAQKYKLEEGDLVYDGGSITGVEKKKVNSKDYWFRPDGVMLAKFYMIDDNMYYFGGSDDGSMKTGSQSIKDNTGDTYKFYFYTKDQATSYKTPNGDKHGLSKGAGVVGNQGNKLYWYGLQIQADDYKYQVATITINGTDYSFIVNSNGTIQHSANTEYKEDGDVLVKTGAYTKKDKDGKDVVIPTTFVKDGQAKYAIEDTNTIKKDVIDVDLGKFFQ